MDFEIKPKYSEMLNSLEQWLEKANFEHEPLSAQKIPEETHELPLDQDLFPQGNFLDQPETLPDFLLSLSPYYLAGFFLESLRGKKDDAWWVTGFFIYRQWFPLDIQKQIKLDAELPPAHPLLVKRAPATLSLNSLGLSFVSWPTDASSYLFRPTPTQALLLISETPNIFVQSKIEATQKYVNNYFNP
ncbi:MAG: hypothetical protein KDD22_03005 [Bdellovibrionales bacterium]|nr:hypothetical protein [Bdellovibrionales bacterium]